MYKHSPLLNVVIANAQKHPTKTAIIMNDTEVTYGELNKNVRKAAAVLNGKKKKRDRANLSIHKDIEYIYLYLGRRYLVV